MSMGQRQAREKSIQRRAAKKAERKLRRRRLRSAGARSGAAVAVTALGLSGLGMAPALAASTDPHPVADIRPGPDGSDPGDKAALGGSVLFAATTPGKGTELWKSDGTAAGTVLVKDIYPGTSSYTYNGHTYTDDNSSWPRDFVAMGGNVYFTAFDEAHGRELWKSDGTATGTVLVKDVNPGSAGSTYSGYGEYGSGGTSLAVIGNTLYFAAYEGEHGQELWASNGTTGGTALLKDITPGTRSETYTDDDGVEHTYTYPNSSSLDGFAAAGTMLFFSNWDETNGRELWKSSGTSAGTAFVKDIYPGTTTETDTYVDDDGVEHTYSYTFANSADPRAVGAIGNTLYFSATDGTNGRELWKSDGSSAGTSLVKDIYPGTSTYTYVDDDGIEQTVTETNQSSPTALASAGSTFFFSARDEAHGRELWKSDGTTGGTVLVKDVSPGPRSGTYSYGQGAGSGAMVGSTLYFSGRDQANGAELWSSDGTTGGTALVEDLFPGTYSYTDNGHTYTYPNSGGPGSFAATGSILFFSADDAARGRELWVIGVDEPATGGGGGGGGAGTPAVNPACAPATTASANAASAVAKAKAKLKKAKKSHNAAKIKKAKAKLKKAKKAATAAAANQSASCA
ncbi:ELWxxDGT repeat protein [Nocardioides nitrophenolicus]|uniref:ELWxxDGT repeat protein n=1 Tax=Nocardioides nitrophenolicus TaxID=60489 RepID=UPI00195E130B|nr:ELWxxDGT repeat protein [Nocardioides nitrophenolicus]MBM7518202.1 ELWxxDGT repeat protein [Nocardioides nitrophenolicus]